jgi:hypothetical protein
LFIPIMSKKMARAYAKLIESSPQTTGGYL